MRRCDVASASSVKLSGAYVIWIVLFRSCRLTSAPRDPAPGHPVCYWVGAILLHTFMVAAIFSLGERRTSTDHHSGTAGLNVNKAGPHPRIPDAQLKEIKSRDKSGGVRR